MNSQRNALLIIDAQYDFCHPNGSLFVPGADKDMLRLAHWLNKNSDHIDFIGYTMDHHLYKSVFHPIWFYDHNGNPPPPFTTIHSSDLLHKKWIARFEPEKTLQYLIALEAQGQFSHTIWPPHCLTGTKGAMLYEPLWESILNWAITGKDYLPIPKGTHPLTEHYGIFEAQIPDPLDPNTALNKPLLEKLSSFDQIFVAGEAKTHCVATSIKQIMNHAPELAHKITLIEDCMSPVPGFEPISDEIYLQAATMMQITKSDSTIV